MVALLARKWSSDLTQVGPEVVDAEELAAQTHARLPLGAPSPHANQPIACPPKGLTVSGCLPLKLLIISVV